MRFLTVLAVSLAVAACGDDHDHDHDHDHGGCGEGHSHDAPHGGEVIGLGDKHLAHVEVKLDHDAGTLTLYVYDADMKKTKADAAPLLRFQADGRPVEVKAEGSGHTWTFTHAGLKGEPEGARFEVRVGGKAYTPEWHHHHDHDHEHDGHEDHEHDHDEDHDHG